LRASPPVPSGTGRRRRSTSEPLSAAVKTPTLFEQLEDAVSACPNSSRWQARFSLKPKAPSPVRQIRAFVSQPRLFSNLALNSYLEPRTSHFVPPTPHLLPPTTTSLILPCSLPAHSRSAPLMPSVTIPAQAVCYNEPTRSPTPPSGRPALTPIPIGGTTH